MIKISIIIPFYNSGEYISKLLDELCLIETADFEAVFINDGSMDESEHIIKEYTRFHSHIRLINRMENLGAGTARNIGIIESLGKYVYFLDADDQFIGFETLNKMYLIAEAEHANVLGGKLIIKRNGEELLDLNPQYNEHALGPVDFCSYQFDYGFTRFIYNRDFLISRNILFPETFCYEDPQFLCTCLHAVENIFFIDEITYIVNEHDHESFFLNHIEDLESGINNNLQFAIQNNYKRVFYNNLRRVFSDFGKLWHISGNENCLLIQYIKQMQQIQKLVLCMPNSLSTSVCFNNKTDNDVFFDGKQKCLNIKDGFKIDFDSYFNTFYSNKWLKYTDIISLSLILEAKGSFEIFLYKRTLKGDATESFLLEKKSIHSIDKQFIYFDIPIIESDTGYSFEVSSFSDDTIIYDGGWFSNYPLERAKVNLSLCYTTYKRESYILRNLEVISKIDNLNIYTYVVDNGNTLSLPDSTKYKVISNRNFGGSGGFARAMIELSKDQSKKGLTHFVLMDDDTTIDHNVLERLACFLSVIKPEYSKSFIGGAMLRNDIPYFQVESGANRETLQVRGLGFGLDMRNPYHCLINEISKESEYNAWWFCCIPVSYLRDDNYPLPIFFQWDDVDYGIRNKAHVITMNGICVWHDSFDSKRSAQMIYYSTRNPMIVDACHEGRMTKRKYLKHFRNIIRDQIYMYRYHEAEAILRGVEDFLKGPDWLIDLKQDEYNSEIMKLNATLQDCEVDMDRYHLCIGIDDCDLLHKIVRKLTFNGMLLKANRKIIIPLYAWRPVQTYRATEVVYYDELTKRGYTAKKNLKKAIECYNKYIKLRKIVAREYDKVGSLYRERYPYMTSKDMWEKILF